MLQPDPPAAAPDRAALAARLAAAYQANPAKSSRYLAMAYGLSHVQVLRLIRANPAKVTIRKAGGRRKLTPAQEHQLVKDRPTITLLLLAKLYGISKATVCRILKRAT